MENCVAPGLDEFDVLLEVVLSLLRVRLQQCLKTQYFYLLPIQKHKVQNLTLP